MRASVMGTAVADLREPCPSPPNITIRATIQPMESRLSVPPGQDRAAQGTLDVAIDKGGDKAPQELLERL
jgi:hypothetical protein